MKKKKIVLVHKLKLVKEYIFVILKRKECKDHRWASELELNNIDITKVENCCCCYNNENLKNKFIKKL